MADTMTTLKPNYIGGVDDPANIAIMSVDDFIRTHNVLPVTSTLIREPSTNNFHEDGLYSETIFGPIASPDRMLLFGYIELNTQILHPKIYNLVIKLGSLYEDIIKGATYAIFDPVTKNFEKVIGDPMDTPGADTGYTFFLRHFREISFKRLTSSKRDDRIEVIEQYKDRAIISRYLVEPAGLRDISNDSSGRLVQDEINDLYSALIRFTRSIPKGSQSILYDPVRFQIQAKAQEIYEYIENFLDGKRGFIQGSFARRKVAMGTRNVITAAPNHGSSPEDPQLHKADDVVVGVYQTIKGLQPFTKNALMTLFIRPIFKNESTTNVALSDIETGELVYTTISSSERDKWTSSEGMDKLINSFGNTDLRSKPVLIKDENDKYYALSFVYDEGEELALCRSLSDLEQRWARPVTKSKLRPITYIELFYIIADVISMDKHAIVTRYPVIEQGSSYVAKIHVISTTPSRSVNFIDLLSDGFSTTLRQYPVIGASYMDAAMVHPSKLSALGGDRRFTTLKVVNSRSA